MINFWWTKLYRLHVCPFRFFSIRCKLVTTLIGKASKVAFVVYLIRDSLNTASERRCMDVAYDVKMLKRRCSNVFLTSCAGWDVGLQNQEINKVFTIWYFHIYREFVKKSILHNFVSVTIAKVFLVKWILLSTDTLYLFLKKYFEYFHYYSMYPIK